MTQPRLYYRLKTITAALIAALALGACMTEATSGDTDDITSLFRNKWNVNEDVILNDNGTITYHSVQWGGLVAQFDGDDGPADWSRYGSIKMEFSEPTATTTQILINEQMVINAGKGINQLEANLSGIDCSTVKQVALQTAEPTTIVVKKVTLNKTVDPKFSTAIWTGNCSVGNWEQGFTVGAERFNDAEEGDVLELEYTAETTNPTVNYWQLKTIYSGSEGETLEGNAIELNDWGCASLDKAGTSYLIKLTAKDVKNLRERGLFCGGYYITVTRVNLLQ